MNRPRYSIKKLKKRYTINAQSGLLATLFLSFFAFVCLYIAAECLASKDFLMAVIFFLLAIPPVIITFVTLRLSITTAMQCRKMFDREITPRWIDALNCAFADQNGAAFQELFLGGGLLILLNPEPHQPIFTEGKKIKKVSVQRVRRGTKYYYNSYKIEIFAAGSSLTGYIDQRKQVDAFLKELIKRHEKIKITECPSAKRK